MAANQGSRAGLITSVVILAIVSVVAVILAFWFGAEKRKSDEQLVDLKKRYTDIISDTALLGADVTEMKAARADADRNKKVWDMAMDQRTQLVKVITGRDAGTDNPPQWRPRRPPRPSPRRARPLSPPAPAFHQPVMIL